MRSTYQTDARAALMDVFRAEPRRRFGVSELVSALGDGRFARSTVYRLLGKLCAEGYIHCFAAEGRGGALYQLAGRSCCSEHLHIKCVDCGLLLHLDEGVRSSLAESTGFTIDESLSMLYGRCARCAGRKK